MCKSDHPDFFFFRHVEHYTCTPAIFPFVTNTVRVSWMSSNLKHDWLWQSWELYISLQQDLFKHLHYFRTFVPCPPSPNSSPLFLVYFSAILVILFLLLLSLACGVLCSPFCRHPRSLFNLMTIFLSLCFCSHSGLLCFSPLFQCSSLLSCNYLFVVQEEEMKKHFLQPTFVL